MIEKEPATSIVNVKVEDLPAILKIHQKAFPQSFMTKIGPKFLKRYFYVALMLEEKYFFALRHDGECVGYALILTEPRRLHEAMALQRVGFAGSLILGLLRRPYLALNVFRGVLRSSSGRKVISRSWELASIGCSMPRKGFGSALLMYGLRTLELSGGDEMTLTTDRFGNESTISFYEKHGFRKVSIEQQGGRDVFRMSYRT